MSKTKIEVSPNSLMAVSKILNRQNFQGLPSREKALRINKVERDAFYKDKEKYKDNVDEFLNELIKIDGLITELQQYLDDTTEIDTNLYGTGLKGGALSVDQVAGITAEIQRLTYELNQGGLTKAQSDRIHQNRMELVRGLEENQRDRIASQRRGRPVPRDLIRRVPYIEPVSGFTEIVPRNLVSNRPRGRASSNAGSEISSLSSRTGSTRSLGRNSSRTGSTLSGITYPDISDIRSEAEDLGLDQEPSEAKQYTFILVVLTKILEQITKVNLIYKSKIVKNYKQISIFDIEAVNSELVKLYQEWSQLNKVLIDYDFYKTKLLTKKINTQFEKLYNMTKQITPAIGAKTSSELPFENSLSDQLSSKIKGRENLNTPENRQRIRTLADYEYYVRSANLSSEEERQLREEMESQLGRNLGSVGSASTILRRR